HDAAHSLGLDEHAIRRNIFLDGDPRQELPGPRIGRGASDALGANLDRCIVTRLDLDSAVGIAHPHFPAGGQRIAVRPLVGHPAYTLLLDTPAGRISSVGPISASRLRALPSSPRTAGRRFPSSFDYG